MNEKFKEALIAAGLTEEQATIYSTLITVTTDEDITEKATQIVEPFKKALTSETDKRVKQAVKTAVANYEKKHNLKEGIPITTEPPQTPTPPTSPTPPATPSTTDPILKSVLAVMESLKTTVEELKFAEVQKSRQSAIQSKLETAKIPQPLQKRFIDNPAWTDEELDAEVSNYKQELTNLGIASLKEPNLGAGSLSVEKAVEEAAKERNAGGVGIVNAGIKAKPL